MRVGNYLKKTIQERLYCDNTLEERLTLGKYTEAPRIDYGGKHKASLLIMRIYTCVLMRYKGRRSRTPPVYSLFKFQSKYMFCIKMEDCLLITVFQNIDELYM